MTKLIISLLILLFSILTGLLVKKLVKLSKLKEPKYKKTYMKTLFLTIICGLLTLIGTIKQYEINVFANKNIVEITVANNKQLVIAKESLISQVIEDPKKADKLYKNKILQISGTVQYIDDYGRFPCISFSDEINSIFFYFNNNEKITELMNDNDLKNLTVTIAGRYGSNSITEKNQFVIISGSCLIRIMDCEILGISKNSR